MYFPFEISTSRQQGVSTDAKNYGIKSASALFANVAQNERQAYDD